MRKDVIAQHLFQLLRQFIQQLFRFALVARAHRQMQFDLPFVVHGTTPGTAVESGAEDEAEIPLVTEGARAAMTAVFEPADEPSPGARMRLGVAPERVHIFDLRTREAIGR